MARKAKPKFKPGNATFALNHEERVILLETLRGLKTKTPLEKQCLKRFILRLMGQPITRVPLRPSKRCPICKFVYAGHTFERHFAICKSEKELEKRVPRIDPTVWELLGGDVDELGV